MNKHIEIFEYLRDELMNWRFKETNPTVNGIGFNLDNVREIESSLPSATEFDYVYVSPPIINERGVTTGARETQRSTQTFTIDIYSRRLGSGAAAKRNTLAAIHENSTFISNLFAKHGFIISMSKADLNYNNNNTARQVINITKTFIG